MTAATKPTATSRLSDTAVVVLARACRSHIAGVPADERPTLRDHNERTAGAKLTRSELGEVVESESGLPMFVPNNAGFALFHHSADDRASIIEDERAGR